MQAHTYIFSSFIYPAFFWSDLRTPPPLNRIQYFNMVLTQ